MFRGALLIFLLLALGLAEPTTAPATKVLRPGDDFDVQAIADFIEAGGQVIAVREAALRLPATVTGVGFDGASYRMGEPVVMRPSPLLAKVTDVMLGRTISEGPLPLTTSFDEYRIATLLSVDMEATPRKAKVHVPTLWLASFGEGRVAVTLGRYAAEDEQRLLDDVRAFLESGETLKPNPQWHRRETAAAMKAMSEERSDANQFEEDE